MVFRLLVDLVVGAHFAYIGFVGVGALLVWRWPWLAWLHLPALLWAVMIIAVGLPCPLTGLERYARQLAGEPRYSGGFVDHYIEGVLYPSRLTPLFQGVALL